MAKKSKHHSTCTLLAEPHFPTPCSHTVAPHLKLLHKRCMLSSQHTDLQIVNTWAIVGHEIMGQGEGGSVAESHPAQLSFQLWKVDPTNGTEYNSYLNWSIKAHSTKLCKINQNRGPPGFKYVRVLTLLLLLVVSYLVLL